MRMTESLPGKHARLARQLIDDARHEIAGGDSIQGSEKLWGAVSHALKAYCASHGLPVGATLVVAQGRREARPYRQAVRELGERLGNPSVWQIFRMAESCHANFYNDWMELEELEDDLPHIEELVNIVLGQMAG